MKKTTMTKLWIKDHRPEIEVTTGVVLGVVALYLAFKKGPKALQAKDKLKENINTIKEVKAKGTVENENGETEAYTQKDYVKDLSMEYIRGGLEIAKEVAPAVLCEGAAIAFTLDGFGVMKTRAKTAAIIAAGYAATLSEVKDRIFEAEGQEGIDKYFNGMKEVEEEVEVTNEKGKTKVVKQRIMRLDDEIDNPLVGPYTIRLDSNNPLFRANGGDALLVSNILQILQDELNRQFQRNDVVWLCDVLNELRVDKNTYPNLNTDVTHNVGWIKGEGDDFIDFGCFRNNPDGSKTIEMVTGKDGSVYLSFNCIYINGKTAEIRKNRDEKWNVILSDSKHEK